MAPDMVPLLRTPDGNIYKPVARKINLHFNLYLPSGIMLFFY